MENEITVFINKDGWLMSPYITDTNIPIKIDKKTGEKIRVCKNNYNGCYVNNEFIEKPFINELLIRTRRQEECFNIIDNRSQLGYIHLTDAQKTELDNGYEAGLIAPETKIIPDKPDGLK